MRRLSDTRTGRLLLASGVWRAFIRSRAGRMLVNLNAIVHGQDLVRREFELKRARRELELERDELERERDQGELIVGSVIERHYLGAQLPPPYLRTHVGVNDAPLNFWQKGVTSSRWVFDVFGTEPGAPILDWGCGSGRTLVWLRCHPAWREQYHGCDVDQDAIEWLRTQGEERVEACDDFPPLPYPDNTFGGGFAFSVLTHIPSDRHRSWYEELHRVCAPGARILFTTHGAWEAERAPASIQDEFARAEQAFVPCPIPEHYKDSVMVSEKFTRQALEGLCEIERFAEAAYGGQDLVVATRC